MLFSKPPNNERNSNHARGSCYLHSFPTANRCRKEASHVGWQQVTRNHHQKQTCRFKIHTAWQSDNYVLLLYQTHICWGVPLMMKCVCLFMRSRYQLRPKTQQIREMSRLKLLYVAGSHLAGFQCQRFQVF